MAYSRRNSRIAMNELEKEELNYRTQSVRKTRDPVKRENEKSPGKNAKSLSR